MSNATTPMRALQLVRLDGPSGLAVREVPRPVPAHGQVLVRVLRSPVNPSDVLFCHGHYGTAPTLPVTPGFEGCGVVETSGGGWLARRLVGRRVAGAVQGRDGFWADYVVLNAADALPMPGSVSDTSAASAIVNPMTALELIRPVRHGRHRAMVQTAGASQVGRMLQRLAHRHGVPLVSIVHRPALAEALTRDGVPYVLDSSAPDFDARLHAVTRELQATWAVDAVAGLMTARLAAGMPKGSTIAVYGVLSGAPAQVSAGDLIFRRQTVTGFWLPNAFGRRSGLGALRALWRIREAVSLLETDLRSVVRAELGLDEATSHLAAALSSTSAGKLYIAPTR